LPLWSATFVAQSAALILFVADFVRIPADLRRMEMDDKNRFERLRTLGQHCGMWSCAGERDDAMRWLSHRAGARRARRWRCGARLVDALGADMMIFLGAGELLLYTSGAAHYAGTWRRWSLRQAALAV